MNTLFETIREELDSLSCADQNHFAEQVIKAISIGRKTKEASLRKKLDEIIDADSSFRKGLIQMSEK